MPTFDSVAAGVENIDTRTVTFLGVPDEVKVSIRGVLTGDEEGQAIFAASRYVNAQQLSGVAHDELYELALKAHRVYQSFLDPEDHTKKFFASFEQVMSDKRIGRERILYFHELQETYGDMVSPSRRKMNDGEFFDAVERVARSGADRPDFFADLSPGMRWSFTRSMAILLADALRHKPGSGTASADKTSETETQPTGSDLGSAVVERL